MPSGKIVAQWHFLIRVFARQVREGADRQGVALDICLDCRGMYLPGTPWRCMNGWWCYPCVCLAVLMPSCSCRVPNVEISNFPIPLRDGLVIDVSFVCEFKCSSRAPVGWNTVCAILMTSYRPVSMSRTTNTRTSMVSCTYKAFAHAIIGISGQIHVDFLRLLWVLADKQMRST